MPQTDNDPLAALIEQEPLAIVILNLLSPDTYHAPQIDRKP